MNGTVAQSLLAYPVYTGIWFNWSQGRIQGATLTLSHQNGGLLTAFLALFITVVASSFWRLFCFAAHFKLSAGKSPQDGLYRTSINPGWWTWTLISISRPATSRISKCHNRHSWSSLFHPHGMGLARKNTLATENCAARVHYGDYDHRLLGRKHLFLPGK